MSIVISPSGRASKPFLDRIRLVEGDALAQDAGALAMVLPQNLNYSGILNDRIQEAAGIDLDAFILENVYKPRAGEVYALPAFNLPVKHLFLGIMPNVRSDFDFNDSDLANIVRRMMELTRCMLLSSIVFPPIACGKGMYPMARGARLICNSISDRLEENIEEVRIVCETDEVLDIFAKKLSAITS